MRTSHLPFESDQDRGVIAAHERKDVLEAGCGDERRTLTHPRLGATHAYKASSSKFLSDSNPILAVLLAAALHELLPPVLPQHEGQL